MTVHELIKELQKLADDNNYYDRQVLAYNKEIGDFVPCTVVVAFKQVYIEGE